MADPMMAVLTGDRAALQESMIPLLDEFERDGCVRLVRDEAGRPVAIASMDVEKLRAEVARLRREM